MLQVVDGWSLPQLHALQNDDALLQNGAALLRVKLSLLRVSPYLQQILSGESLPRENPSSGKLGKTFPQQDMLAIEPKMLHHLSSGTGQEDTG